MNLQEKLKSEGFDIDLEKTLPKVKEMLDGQFDSIDRFNNLLHEQCEIQRETIDLKNNLIKKHDEENKQLRYRLEESTRYLKYLPVIDDNLEWCMEIIERNEKLLGGSKDDK